MTGTSRSTCNVSTTKGRVKGQHQTTLRGRRITAFKGIPYAKPPVGHLRFQRSQPCDSWQGTLDARKESKPNIQPNMFFPTSTFRLGSEDCLYLNVFTSDVTAVKPVLVFIHGGAFVVGSNNSKVYGAQALLDLDVVLVTMNYRLGPLGFLTLESDIAPGNLGLHDQHLALAWIHENIAAFGGDPGNVTLMGESAGAMSALLHTVSPYSSGLFHKVVALSGTPSTVFIKPNRAPKLYAMALAKKLGCEPEDPDSVLKFLQQQPLSRIMKHCMMFMDWDYPNPHPWIPCVDSYCSEPFLPLPFREAVQLPSTRPVPVLFSFCKDEGLLLISTFLKEPKRIEFFQKGWDTWAPHLVFNKERDIVSKSDVDACRKIKDFYFDNEPLDKDNLNRLKDIFSMSYFIQPIFDDAKLLSSLNWEVSILELACAPSFSLFRILKSPVHRTVLKATGRALGFRFFRRDYGVCHGDDLGYLFPLNIAGLPPTVRTDDQRFAQRSLLQILDNVSQGRPAFHSVVGGSDYTSIISSGSCESYVSIGTGEQVTGVGVTDSEVGRQLRFWNSLALDAREPSHQPFSKFYKKPAVNRK